MTEIVDVWMQHPTLRHSNHDMFESLRRWMGIETFDEVLPIELTLAAMHEAGVTAGLTAAWYGPEGSLISNDEVAEFVARSQGLLVPVAGADIRRPMEAVRELRDRGLLREIEVGGLEPRGADLCDELGVLQRRAARHRRASARARSAHRSRHADRSVSRDPKCHSPRAFPAPA